jgi:hypothetical protein
MLPSFLRRSLKPRARHSEKRWQEQIEDRQIRDSLPLDLLVLAWHQAAEARKPLRVWLAEAATKELERRKKA